MAVARRSSNTLAYSGGRTSTVIPAPASIVNGDVLIAIIHAGNGATTPVTITPPTGWAEITGSPAFLAKSDPYVISNHVFRKVASSESGSYTFTHASADTEALIYSLSGADTAAAVISSHDSGVGTTTTIPGITTTVDGSFVIMSESNWDGTAGEVPPTGTTPTFTQRLAGSLMYVSDGVMTTAGATGAKSHTNGNLSNQPWVGWLFAVPATSGGGGVTGSLAATESGSDTASFSGSVKATGTLAATETGSDTAAFSGSVKASGSLAATESGADTASAFGSVASSGSLAATEAGSDTAAGTGTITTLGTLAAAEAGTDTASAAGSVQATGTLAATEAGADTAAVSGSVTAPGVAGFLAATESSSDTAAGTGSVEISGSLTASEAGADTVAASGSVEASGSLAAVETGSDTAALSGDVAAPSVSGVLVITESGADVIAIIGTVSVAFTPPSPDPVHLTGSAGRPSATGRAKPATLTGRSLRPKI